MNEFIANLPQFTQAIGETIFMVVITIVAAGTIGLVIGVGLYATRPGNILQNAWVFNILNVVVNIIRPIPFIIFI